MPRCLTCIILIGTNLTQQICDKITSKYQKTLFELTFCSFRYFTDRKAPKNIGNTAIITKLKYAIAMPSILVGGFSVTFCTASLTASSILTIGISVADSAISYEFCRNAWRDYFRTTADQV